MLYPNTGQLELLTAPYRSTKHNNTIMPKKSIKLRNKLFNIKLYILLLIFHLNKILTKKPFHPKRTIINLLLT